MMKELERVRNERDSLRAKLATGGSSSSGRDKALKPSVSNSAMSASESTSSNNGVDGNAMPVMARHHSDDIGQFISINHHTSFHCPLWAHVATLNANLIFLF